ncbi:EamA family transporter [Peptacetobacter hominis]|uniref:EamA family transporter n=1 Tax=Peptacetobacter hominis TaxID=2743610 RepID=A0A544QVS4_9FIRM|nr:DMT family transporter [Peptacetobacter hominis]TQQ84784.1 EamA family transporter [Peptacetobacter hominis]
MEKSKKGYIYIALAGTIWSTLGLFGTVLMERGLSSEQVAFTRLFIGFIVLFAYTGVKNRNLLKLNLKGIIYCAAIGIICQGIFNMCYFKAVEKAGVSAAAVLLYTSPLFLAVFSGIIYKEKITKLKVVSLMVCFAGAFMAVTGGKLDFQGLSSYGIIMGIMAAVTYALMGIISRKALEDFSSETILIYGFLFGAFFMIPSAKPVEMLSLASDPMTFIFMMLLGIFPAAIAYIFYAKGIASNTELSVVGVVASIELIIASFIGWIIIGEVFTIGKLLGVFMMFMSATMALQTGNQEENSSEYEKTFEYVDERI